jgi:hypothetical protein
MDKYNDKYERDYDDYRDDDVIARWMGIGFGTGIGIIILLIGLVSNFFKHLLHLGLI